MKSKNGQVQILVAGLLLLSIVLGYLLFTSPNFAPTINAATQFWITVQWWILGAVILIILWKIGLFRALKIGA